MRQRLPQRLSLCWWVAAPAPPVPQGRAGREAAPTLLPPASQRRLSPAPAAGSCRGAAPSSGAAEPRSPCPIPCLPTGGWPRWAQRSLQLFQASPGTLRGWQSWRRAVGGCVGGRWCFPSSGWFLPPPQPCPCAARAERWALADQGLWGAQRDRGRCISCPLTAGLATQYRAALQHAPTWEPGREAEASGRRDSWHSTGRVAQGRQGDSNAVPVRGG